MPDDFDKDLEGEELPVGDFSGEDDDLGATGRHSPFTDEDDLGDDGGSDHFDDGEDN